MIKLNFFKKNILVKILVVTVLLGFQPVQAQKKKNSRKKEKTVISKEKKSKKNRNDKSEVKKEKNSLKELTKKTISYEGLFTIYQDSLTGNIKMLVKDDQIGKEFIYFSQIADGVSSVGTFRGAYRNSKVFKIEKYFNKIEFIIQNTSSYFNPENAISKSSSANLSDGVIASLIIENSALDTGLYLIDANQLFLSETFSQIKPPNHPNQNAYAFTLGNLNNDKTKIKNIRSYPSNTDLAIEYVYSKSNTINNGPRSVADGRNVSIKVFHSLIEMPINDFEPLIDDPRVGFFTTKVSDMTSNDFVNYRDLVHHWNLKKKNPDLPISEPVQPIVWWIENTTPLEIRPIIKKAGELWNLAFEEAGFRNAIVLKQQSDTSKWDAGDIRYNVLRWTSSPNPRFNGYGPSFVNPRTGEILGADIMLEFKSLSFFINLSKLIGNNKSYDGIEIPSFIHDCNHPVCNTLESGQVENIFGGLALESLGSTKTERDKMSKQYLTYLILHEIGHTLGLNHNMKSSQLHSLNDIHNLELTSKVGLIGSVMDYPSINIALEKSKQGLYYTTRPGPYDLWAIKYAYQKGRSVEETKSLLAKSTKHELMFGNDSDDMRFPGRAIDPRVNVMDLSSDAIAYSVDRLKLTKLIGDNFLKNLNEEGISYHKHRVLYNILLSMQRIQANTISRYIGGVYVERAFIGQEGGTQPFTPVPLEKQKEAMRALDEYVFSPDAFTFPNEIYNYLQLQRRGFGFFRVNEDPKIHQAVLSNQKTILSHLLHKNTLQRIIDSELYGNAYKLSDFMSDINNVIFKKDIYENVNSFRQNLQIEYTKILIKMLTGEKSEMFLPTIKSTILSNLMRVKKMALNSGGDKSTQAHKSHLVLLIENALEEVK